MGVRLRAAVIGIVGGIGSGKSEVARALERLGCVVANSDAIARELMERADVRAEIAGWWGPAVIGENGEIDRAAVAKIVFADAEARRRLEAFIHPRIHEARRVLIAEVRTRRDVPAIVVDAPLLFEAGVDRECDAVIFVDAPWETRLERVQRTRGWDSAELARREAAQMDLAEKRRRSGYVIENTGSVAAVEAAAARVLGAVVESIQHDGLVGG